MERGPLEGQETRGKAREEGVGGGALKSVYNFPPGLWLTSELHLRGRGSGTLGGGVGCRGRGHTRRHSGSQKVELLGSVFSGCCGTKLEINILKIPNWV